MPTVRSRSKKRVEFGDFQTPATLSHEVCQTLGRLGIRPVSVVEPTCGRGALLVAAIKAFADAEQFLGYDVNPDYVAWTQRQIEGYSATKSVVVEIGDFFETDWQKRLASLRDPILIIGNPPWVTNSTLGSLGGKNLPTKQNSQGLRGIEALTGKSNFDISEWMLCRMVEWMKGRDATLAMLCKTAVARKILQRGWLNNVAWCGASIHQIDAMSHFDAAVDACLLVIHSQANGLRGDTVAAVFESLGAVEPTAQIGWRDEALVADLAAYENTSHLMGRSPIAWRSGVKHDCSKVFELCRDGEQYRNGFGQLVSLEPQSVFPMLKSSDIARGKVTTDRWMLVTQHSIGEETAALEQSAPLTWDYLNQHAEFLDRRASSIYLKRPRFSVFGVGEYSFRPWKVAISGFYKQLTFHTVGPISDRPVVLDDTCYFLPCDSEQQARVLCEMLNSANAQNFFTAFAFWDSKRPITIDLLQRLDLAKLAEQLGCGWPRSFVTPKAQLGHATQQRLF